jgi:hypothetical protein
MSEPATPLQKMLSLRPEVIAAMQRANQTALLRHARLGEPVSTWRDGKVVWLSPAEVFALYNLDEFGRPKLENDATSITKNLGVSDAIQ